MKKAKTFISPLEPVKDLNGKWHWRFKAGKITEMVSKPYKDSRACHGAKDTILNAMEKAIQYYRGQAVYDEKGNRIG